MTETETLLLPVSFSGLPTDGESSFPEEAFRALPTARLSEEEEKELASVGFSFGRVLVGSVRSDAQYRHCKNRRYYYAPAKYLKSEDLPISYVAIYRPSRLGEGGISDVGVVLRTARLPRFLIPYSATKSKPFERYYAFAVRSFEPPERPIPARGIGVAEPRLTTPFLLRHASESYELFALTSEEEYRLHSEIKKILTEADYCDTGCAAPRRVGKRAVLFARDRKFSVCLFGRQTFARFEASEYEKRPQVILAALHQYLSRED